MERPGSGGDQAAIYCIVPADLADQLARPLAEFFADDSAVDVIVDRRRTRRPESGNGAGPPPPPPRLPRKARRHADRLIFANRADGGRDQRDQYAAGVVRRVQEGDVRAMEDLYVVYSGEVFAFALASLHNRHEAQDVAQQIFVRVLASIGTYSPRAGIPFRAWLFRIARNEVLNTRRGVTRRRELPESPVAMQMRRELQRQDDPGALSALSWIRDADLQALVDRLPASQREVLLLRHGFDLTMDQIATITARSPAAVSELHRRALAYLKERLEAVEGRRSRRRRREPMRVRFKPARVIVSRRFALGPVRRPMRLY